MKTETMLRVILFIFLAGCATYTDQISKVRFSLSSGETQKALDELEKSRIAERKEDEVVFRMERGMLKYLSGDLSEATKDWAKAHQRSDELYTTSITRTLASVSVSEDLSDYEGEDHEKVLLPIFSALAFFSAGELPKAVVEIRKTYELINKLKLEETEQKGKIDGFPFLVSGLIYEASLNWDAAIIEYKKSLARYLLGEPGGSVEIKHLVADSLWRIAEFRRRNDILTYLSEAGFKKPEQSLNDILAKGEIIVVVEAGQSPIKVAQDYPINLGTSVINISFPRYQRISNPNFQTTVNCEQSQCAVAAQASDIGYLAQQALERRRLKDFAKMTARLLIKEQARQAAKKHLGDVGSLAVMLTNLATERADTRSWTLLPSSFQVARIPIPSDKNVNISISTHSALKPNEWTIKLAAGKKKLVRVRTL